jgi:hypothetical protein
MTHLADYTPPSARRASIAVGLAPIIVLLAFTAIVAGLIEVDTGFATFAACTVWVVFEMHQYQAAIDSYNEAYVDSHLAWRSPDALRELASAPGLAAPTQDFVSRFVDARGTLLRDGQLP